MEDNYKVGNDWSMAFWFRPDVSSGGNVQIFTFFDQWYISTSTSFKYYDCELIFGSGFTFRAVAVSHGVVISDKSYGLNFSTGFDTSTWKHFTFVNDSSSMKFYLDSSLMGSFPTTTWYPDAGGKYMYLNREGGILYQSNYYDFGMDELYIYNKAIDVSTILELYNRI
jgi:hypothetical protein